MHAWKYPSGVLIAVVCMILGQGLSVRAESVSAVELLFEGSHFENLAEGQQLDYTFSRSTSTPDKLGAPFEDKVRLVLGKAGDKGERNINLRIFTGKRARDPFDLPDMTGNPMVVWFLDRAVNNYGTVSGGSRNYLKSRVRAGVQSASTVAREDVMHGGKKVAAYRIVITPFAKDPNAKRMLGYQGSKIVVVASKQVPGRLISVHSVIESTLKNAPRLEERINLVADGDAK